MLSQVGVHARPAILGGERAVRLDEGEANRWPIFTQEDEAAVLEVLRDGDLSTHAVARRLEDDYREYFGVKHALSHCNGTAALLASFFALDLEPGSEVLAPTATFWASAVPMLWCGLVPVFCESEGSRLGIDPADAERRITPRTRAIVVVHLFGMPSRMTEILDLARRHGLKVIEDASHAHGAVWRGRKCGTLGDVSVFSLQGHKLAPAGEGGMLLTNDDAIMERAVALGDMVRTLELATPARRFAGTTFGIKTRIASLSAAVARVQFRHLDERNARRNENIEYLSERLGRLGIEPFRAPPHVRRVYFEFIVRVHGERIGLARERLVEALRAEGCDVHLPRYPLLHQQPLFTEGVFRSIPAMRTVKTDRQYRPDDLPLTTQANGELLRLPSFPSASRALLDQYAEAFEKVLAHATALV